MYKPNNYYLNNLVLFSDFLNQYTYALMSLLQALKAVAHNYPNVIALCWEQISSIIYGVLSSFSDVSPRLWRGSVDHTVASIKERVMTAAVKVNYLPFYIDDTLSLLISFSYHNEFVSFNNFLKYWKFYAHPWVMWCYLFQAYKPATI